MDRDMLGWATLFISHKSLLGRIPFKKIVIVEQVVGRNRLLLRDEAGVRSYATGTGTEEEGQQVVMTRVGYSAAGFGVPSRPWGRHIYPI